MSLPKVMVILCLMFLCFNLIAGAKTPEPDEPWAHKETPDELEQKLHSLLHELDEVAGHKYNDACDTSIYEYKAYKNLTDELQILEGDSRYYDKFEMFENRKPMNFYYKTLTSLVNKKKKFFCPITKGMTCKDKICSCRTDYPGANKDNIKVNVTDDLSACYFQEGSNCKIEWETKCMNNTNCLVKKDANQPEANLSCTQLNLDKYFLKNSDTCSCEFNVAGRHLKIDQLLDSIKAIPPINYGESCEVDHERNYAILEKVVESNSIDDFYMNKGQYNSVVSSLEDGLKTGSKMVCNKNKVVLVCSNLTKTCVCKYSGTYQSSDQGGRCELRSGSECDIGDIPCPTGEKCVFDIKSLDTKVLCTESNMKDLDQYEQISKKCICSPHQAKKRFQSKDLHKFHQEDKRKMAELVRKVHDISNWKVLARGDNCSWDVDRAYFQLDDYVRANLEHVYFKTRYYKDVQSMINSNGAKNGVCHLINKSMRCDFLQQKCLCPTDGYLLEEIPSTYDSGLDRCVLKSGSLCHTTLTEWIQCPQGEKCMYKEIPVLCDRKNQKKIVDKKMRLKSAKCFCSSTKVQEIDDKLAKRFQHKERTEF